MSDTGQLLRLTDQQVNARLAAYNAGGSLERDIALLRENAADLIAAEITANFGKERARALRLGLFEQGRCGLDPGHRRIWPPDLSREDLGAGLHRRPRRHGKPDRRTDARPLLERPGAASGLHERILPNEHVRDRHHSRPGRASGGDRRCRSARPRQRAFRAPRRRAGPREHRTVQRSDRAHPFDRRFGARNAGQDQRSRRGRRAIRRRDARSGPDRRRASFERSKMPGPKSRSPRAWRLAPATRRARR